MHPNGQSPPGAYPSGTQLTVGSHQVQIKNYISEGGFAHVYVVETNPPDVDGSSTACLKRVAVPDKVHLNLLRSEVDAMKRLRGHDNIVRYIDSHAARMADDANGSSGGYEVFLLMEYCSKNGLIDFMNTRLRDQLTEPEVLKIMYDITSGLASMHYLDPPLIHRDLKIENVLISADGTYKLCDFGSVSPVLRPPKSSQEYHILEEDIQRHTTAQYRSPEMIDIYRGHPIDEKCDIWALGVFLYKLCYYTTPFEKEGQLAILHARFEFLPRPNYSDRLKRVISALLREDPRNRPNVYQVLKEVSSMRGVECPIADKYSIAYAQQQQVQQQQQQPPQQPQTLEAHRQIEGLSSSNPSATSLVIPTKKPEDAQPQQQDVTPMYRGRPNVKKSVPPPTYENMSNAFKQQQQQQQSQGSKANKNAVFTDPFALLDSGTSPSPVPSNEAGNAAATEDYNAASSKFPTVEELTKNLEQKTFYFDQRSPSSSPPKNQPPPPSSIKQRQILFDEPQANGLNPKASSLSSSSSSSGAGVIENPIPQKQPEQMPPPPLPRRSQNNSSSSLNNNNASRRRPVSMYVQSASRSGSLLDLSDQDDDNNKEDSTITQETYPEQQLIGTNANDERDELKNFLTGVSQHSNTVVLEGGNHIDSNVDFLKALDSNANTEPTHYYYGGSLHKRSSSQNQQRKSSSHSQRSNNGESSNGGLTPSWKIRRSGSSKGHHSKRSSISSIKGKLNDAFTRSSPSQDNPRTVSGGVTEKRSSFYQQQQQQPGLSGRFSYSTDSLPGLDSNSAREENELVNNSNSSSNRGRNSIEKPSPPATTTTTAMKPSATISDPSTRRGGGSSLIQNRIQNFLSRTDSPPPKPTASGYGKYTDEHPKKNHKQEDDHGNDEDDTLTSESTMAMPPPPQPTRQYVTVEKSSRPVQHERQLSTISSTSSSGSTTGGNSNSTNKVPPTKPTKPTHLKSPPKKNSVSNGENTNEEPPPPLPTRRSHQRSTSNDSEDWEAKFNQKYPSLG